MFGLGMKELIVILAIAFLIFGAGKLPEIARALGRSIGSLKKGIQDSKEEADQVSKSSDKEEDSAGEKQ